MKKVYFISGLGADKRAFGMMDLSFCEPIFIDWIKPHKNETLCGYATRLREQIIDRDPTIVGLSFGGMLATEMAKADPGLNAIIISSNKSSKEFPAYLRIGKYLPVYKWMPGLLFKNGGLNWILGAQGEENKKLVRSIIADSDPAFLKWAINAILQWKETKTPSNIKHIHGNADRLLPFRYVKADFVVEGGTHLVTINNAREVSMLLKNLIN
jgi:pimeloyl-ACP methyl ester carboxylesterase